MGQTVLKQQVVLGMDGCGKGHIYSAPNKFGNSFRKKQLTKTESQKINQNAKLQGI